MVDVGIEQTEALSGKKEVVQNNLKGIFWNEHTKQCMEEVAVCVNCGKGLIVVDFHNLDNLDFP